MPRIKAASLEAHHELVWQDITEALSRLLLQRDYDSINFGHIATEAGIARNTLYNYAPDKTALVVAVTERASRPVLDRVAALGAGTGPATDRLAAIIDEVLRAFTSGVIRLMLHAGPSVPVPVTVVRERRGPFGVVLSALEEVVRDGVDAGEFRPVDDVAFTVSLLGGVVRAGTDRMVLDALEPERVIPAVQDIVLSALASSPRR